MSNMWRKNEQVVKFVKIGIKLRKLYLILLICNLRQNQRRMKDDTEKLHTDTRRTLSISKDIG